MANLDKSTASRAIAQLEEKQLLEKTVSPNDKRASILFLSEQGWLLYKALAPKALAWETKLLEAFSDSEKQLLYKVLNKLTQ
jgi:DNA-binding MarR family transcriptional regulator